MNKQELAKQYADKKVVKKGQYIECDFDVRKELTTFDGYDIEQAFEDGYDAAIEMACIFIKETTDAAGMGDMKQRLKTFRKSMEDNV